jgi:hypothetical protein
MKKLIAGIIIGCALTASTSVFANTIKEYILTRVDYPIVVKGKEYKNSDLPALNYQGNTYVPLKALGDVLGADVKWNQELSIVEIGANTMPTSESAPSYSSQLSGGVPILTQPSNTVATTNQPEVLNNYLTNAGSPAIKLQGVIYLPVHAGAEKYNVVAVWDASLNLIKFEKSDIQVKISGDMGSMEDGFIYQSNSYIKESIFVEASKQVQTQIEKDNQKLDADYPKFKELFVIEYKTLTSDNSVYVHANNHGSNDEDLKQFFDYLNKLGDLKKKYMEKYAVEIQLLNSQYPLDIRFNYYGTVNHFLADITVGIDGTIKQSYINEIANPNPDQSNIK